MKNKISPKELIDLVFEIGTLKKILRTGWVVKGVKDSESVAEHSFRVAILGMLLAPQFNFDQNKIIKMCLLDDIGEATIGDIRWEEGKVVISTMKEKQKNDESRAVEKMFAGNPLLAEYIDLWKEFEDQQTPEAKFVKQLDKLEMVIQALEYESEGSNEQSLQEFWDNAEKYIKDNELEEYFEVLKSLRKK